jgi:hypothetical protein
MVGVILEGVVAGVVEFDTVGAGMLEFDIARVKLGTKEGVIVDILGLDVNGAKEVVSAGNECPTR